MTPGHAWHVKSCYPKMDGMEIHPKAHHGEEIPTFPHPLPTLK